MSPSAAFILRPTYHLARAQWCKSDWRCRGKSQAAGRLNGVAPAKWLASGPRVLRVIRSASECVSTITKSCESRIDCQGGRHSNLYAPREEISSAAKENRIMKIEIQSEPRSQNGEHGGTPNGTPTRALVVGDEEA